MNEYTASNGITVRSSEYGDLAIVNSTCPILAPSETQALREFSQAERDEQLGRERDPENPDFVFYPGSNEKLGDDYVNVLDERKCIRMGAYYRNSMGQRAAFGKSYNGKDLDEYERAAIRYFMAHPKPEPKPWHDAKIGELWDVTTANQEDVRCFVVHDEPFSFVTADTTHHKPDSIIAAHRIYPPADPS